MEHSIREQRTRFSPASPVDINRTKEPPSWGPNAEPLGVLVPQSSMASQLTGSLKIPPGLEKLADSPTLPVNSLDLSFTPISSPILPQGTAQQPEILGPDSIEEGPGHISRSIMPLKKPDPHSWGAHGIDQDRIDRMLDSRCPLLTINVPEDALHDLILKGYEISDDVDSSASSKKASFFMCKFWRALSQR